MDPSALYSSLLAHYGPQSWWPADEPFEVMVGAILVQNTAWINAERAVAGLDAVGDSPAKQSILGLTRFAANRPA